MRHCVLRHHVCLCVLSTAMLAGFALLTEQREGYAAQRMDYCKETVSGRGERIECDGKTGRVEDSRTIDMNGAGNINKPAVKVYNKANITITSKMLTITDRGKSNSTHPAILVESGGVLKVVNVTMTDVYKGIEVGEGGGSVMVNQGTITIRPGGDSVIEVKGGGKVTLNEGVTVNGGGDSTGIVVGGTGGNVTLMTKNFTGVNKGIVFKEMGSGQAANVTGVGAGTMMTVTAGGTGIMMEGAGVTANASVMSMTVKGQNSGTGVDMKNGMLTLTNLDMTGFDRGAQVSNGKLTVMGGEIKVEANGVGLSVEGMGSASVMGGKITTTGGGVTGVDMKGTGKVELSGVTVSNFATGISVTKGTVTVSGESTIRGTTVGVEVKGNGNFVAVMSGEGKIEVTTGTGLKVMGEGTVSVTGGKITTSGSGQGTGVLMEGEETVTLSGVTVSNFATGISVTGEGTVTMNGDSTIQGVETGVSVQSGKFVASMSKEGKIEVTAGTGVGLKVMGTGSASVTGGKITTSGGGGTGVEAGGKTVELTGVKIEKFETGISVTSGEVRVNGESGIVVTADGVGLKVMDQGTAIVMNTTITANGSGSTGVVMEGTGKVTLSGVGVSEFKTGISVTSGEVTVSGNSTIKGKSVGVSVTGGTFMMEGAESGIMVEANGTGLKVEKTGTATVMNTTITTSGSGTGTGVLMTGDEMVTLSGVTVTGFKTGVNMTKGKFKMTRGSITGNGVTGNIGVYATGGDVTLDEGVEISGFTTGVDVESGTLTISGGKITGTGSGGSYGVQVANGGTLTDVTISSFVTGVSVTGGTFKMTRGSIKEFTEYGIYVGDGVTRADLDNVMITGQNKGTGVYAEGGNVTLEGMVKISKVTTGVYMTKGTLTMTGGTEIELASGNGYGVYVGREVTRATLNDVTITGQNKGTGVYALGAETMTMTLTGVKISNVDKGVYARGKVVTISGGTRIEGVKEYGVYVEGAVTSVNLNDVKIRGKGSGSRYGVYAASGTVTMTEVKISEVEMGIVVSGGQLTIKKGTEISLASGGRYGVYVGEKVTKATLTETVITGQNKGYGVYAEGYGNGKTGEVKLEGVTISKVTTGVEVKSGKSLMISGNSTISFTGDYGVGVIVGDGVKSANLNNVTIRGESNNGYGGTGIHAMGKVVMISGGEISQVKTGVHMEGKGTLTMTGGTKINLARKGEYGVYVKNTAMTNLTGTVITGKGSGMGIYAVGGTTAKNGALTMELTLTGVTISEVETGVYMTGGESLTIRGNSTISVVGSGTGVRAIGGDVMLQKVEIKGWGLASTGVEVWGGKEVTLTNVGISNVGKGVTMKNGGMLTISGESSVISFVGDGVGVKVEGDVTKADLNDVTIRGNGSGGMGVYAEGTGTNGALTMTLDKVRIEGVGMGVYAGGGTLTVNKGTTISFVGDGDYGVGVGVGALVTSASLDNVTITGNGSGGIGVHAMEGEVMMTDVKISQVGAGVSVEGSGSLTVERGEIKEFMDYGVYVGGKVTRADLMGTVITGQNRGNGVGGTGVVMESSGKMMLEDVGISNVGKGVTMKNGGMLTISGERSVISFVGEYGVYAGGDVKNVRLDGVTITGNGSGGMGVHAMGTTGKNGAFRMELTNVKISEVGAGVVMGKGKSLTISGGSIAKVKTGVIMMSGESMTVERGTTIEFTGKYGYGVMVGIDVTRATLNDVTIRGNGSGGMGVYAEGTGTNGALTMTLDKVRISEVGAGVVMEGDGTLTVNKGTTIELASDGKYGVYVKGDVSASLIETMVTGGGMGSMGVYVEGKEVTLTLTDVGISQVEAGVYMKSGESLTISGERSVISFTGKDGYGVYVGDGVMAELIGTTIRGQKSGTGVYAVGMTGTNGMLTMELAGVTISGVGAGVVMMGGEKLTIRGIDEKNSTINFAGDYGVYVGGWVTKATLDDVTIRGGGIGSTGVYALGMEEVTMTLTDVDISQVGMGVVMKGRDGTLTIRGDSTISFVGSGYGVYAEGGVMAELTGTTIRGENRGSGTGVIMESSGKMMLEDVKIEGIMTGVYAENGELEIKGKTEIEFAKNGWGVVVGNKVTRATLDDVTITGKGGSGSMGVYVVGYGMGAVGGGGDVTLEKVRIEGVETGVSMVWGKSLTISGGAIAKVKTGVSVKNGGMLTVKEGTTISFVEDYGVYVGGGVMAKLIGTTIKGEGMGKMGVYVEETGVVELNMVTTEGVETGVAMTRSGMLVISGDSTINFVGDYGVYVKNTAMVELAKTRIIGQNSGRGGNNGVKYGVYATGGDVTMTLNDVTIEEVKTGITMLGGGLKVSGGSIKGVTTGIAMSGSGTLMVEKGTEIQFTKGYGVMVGGGVTVGERVTAKLTETTIRGEGKGSTGVYVAGGDALLEQVKIEGSNQATGLYVTQGAVRLKNTTLRDVAMGMTISQGVVMMEGGELEFTDRYGVSVSGGQAVLSGFKIIKKGIKIQIKVQGCGWVTQEKS